MFSLLIECEPADRDLLIADLWERGSAGISEPDDHHVRAFFEDEADRDGLVRLFPAAVLRDEEPRDWVAAARDLMRPMEIGRRFFLVPEWLDDPAPSGRFRIAVNPGMAFGTGVHETTQLCIEALEQYVRPGMRVLDVGTGSGILAQAATLLGASQVYACDIDPIAVAIAGTGFVGSADAVAPAAVDLVVANISPEAIIALAPDLRRVLRHGGVLLASGFEGPEVDAVRPALEPIQEVRYKGNWSLAVSLA